jgi:uncharacterized protein (TIGR02598 family)
MRPSRCKSAGFSLVELTLALGVTAFCLIAVFGLMPIGVQANRNATFQTRATNIGAAVAADLRGTPRANNTSPQFGITFGTPRTLYFADTGNFTTLLGTNSQYRLSVTWNITGGCSTALPCADIKVTWPAPADPATTAPSGAVEMSAAFDRK